jgi:branched-chain amino acid transport system permease protein
VTVRRLLSPRVLTLVLLAAAIALLPLIFPSGYYYRVAALVWISGLAAVGLNVLMGLAGQVSLGHAGFFGIGAYAVALGPAHLGLPPWAALVLGAGLAGVLAYLVGKPVLRLRGHYLAIATLGLGVLVAIVLTNESRWTGGPDGMRVARLVLFGWRVAGAETWYWVTGGALIAGTWLALNLLDAPTGRALRALRAFVIAAVYASVAGSLLALMNGFITPDQAGFLHSVELVTMVVVGGLGSVAGAIVGAAVLVTLPQLLTVFQDYENALLGILIMTFMIFLREGIVPSLRAMLPGRRAARAA